MKKIKKERWKINKREENLKDKIKVFFSDISLFLNSKIGKE